MADLNPFRAPEGLRGLGVLVTRPAAQAAPLCALIAAAGGIPIPWPAIEIRPVEDLGPARSLVARLDRFDLAVFVSRNAVQHAVPLIRAQWPALPPRLHLAAVGAGTAEDLAAHGLPVQWVPHARLGTEGLLALGGLHRQAGRVLIVRGQGGREVLGQSLRERGAEVHYAEVYRRVVPDLDVAPLLRRWQGGEVHLVVSTSNEGLQNLYQMLGEAGRTLLRAAYLVVLSPRAAVLARELGFLHPATVAANPSDAALFDALKASAATHAGSLAKVKASL